MLVRVFKELPGVPAASLLCISYLILHLLCGHAPWQLPLPLSCLATSTDSVTARNPSLPCSSSLFLSVCPSLYLSLFMPILSLDKRFTYANAFSTCPSSPHHTSFSALLLFAPLLPLLLSPSALFLCLLYPLSLLLTLCFWSRL